MPKHPKTMLQNIALLYDLSILSRVVPYTIPIPMHNNPADNKHYGLLLRH